MKIIKQANYVEGSNILRNGGLIAFPTETVFGLGVIYDNKESYDRLVTVKRRPPEKPFTLMLADPEDVEKYAELNDKSSALVKAFMPGQFTLIAKAKSWLPRWCVSAEGTVGIRIADYKLIRDLIRKTGKPLLVPSANKAGEPPANKTEEVISIFEGEIDAVIEGESISKTPSTIVLVDESTVHIVREGVITLNEINKILRGGTLMKIVVASDHAGFAYKEEIKKFLISKNMEVIDVGTNSIESCDYPIFAQKAAKKVADGEADFGVLVCSSGEGISIAANKVKGIRAGIAYNDDVARLMRQHNNANMIAFGATFMELPDVLKRIEIFLNTPFEGGRHERRVSEIE